MSFTGICKAAVVAALTLAAVPQGVMLPLVVGGSVLVAGEAVAGNHIPGIYTVIKHGKTAVAKGVSDEKGEVRFEGLKPGDYTVTVGENEPQAFSIKKRGIIVIILVEGKKHKYVGHVTLLR